MNVTGPAVFSLRSITGFHNATTATTYSLLGEDLPQSAAIEMRSDLGMPVDVVFGNSDALSDFAMLRMLRLLKLGRLFRC